MVPVQLVARGHRALSTRAPVLMIGGTLEPGALSLQVTLQVRGPWLLEPSPRGLGNLGKTQSLTNR